MLRRFVIAVTVFVFLMVGGAIGLLTYIGRPGSETGLEQWIGRYLVRVIESHITPQVTFETIDYQAPRTVVVQNLRLSAEERDILTVQRMRLELAERPRQGEPIRIQRVDLQQPDVLLRRDAEGAFTGWSGFVRPEVRRDLDSVPKGRRLSDALVLRYVEIADGRVTYADARTKAPPMVLPGIEFALETPPAKDNPGWHELAGTLTREPFFRASLQGRINLDTAVLDVGTFGVHAELREQQYAALPPQVQQFLKRHQVQGSLQLAMGGRVPLKNPRAFEADIEATLTDAQAAFRETIWPVGRLALKTRLPGGPARLSGDGVAMHTADRASTPLELEHFELDVPEVSFAWRSAVPFTLELTSPSVELVKDERGEYVGWSRLAGSGRTSSTQPAGTASPAGGRTAWLSRFVPQRLAIDGAEFVHAVPPGNRWAVDGVRILLEQAGGGAPEWNNLRCSVKTGEELVLEATGGVDWAGPTLDVRDARLDALIDQGGYAVFPSGVQEFLQRHKAKGRIAAQLQGRLPLNDAAATDASFELHLREVALDSGNWALPVENLSVSGTCANSRVGFHYRIDALGGKALGSGNLDLRERHTLRLAWEIDRVRMTEVARVFDRAGRKYAGRIESNGSVQTDLSGQPRDLRGEGDITVRDAQLVNLPVVAEMRRVLDLTGIPLKLENNDSARARFHLWPDHARLSSVEIDSDLVSLRGDGRIYYDGRLDLQGRAKPLQRLRSHLGRIGELLGTVTDRMVSYQIAGTIGHPEVQTRPLGFAK